MSIRSLPLALYVAQLLFITSAARAQLTSDHPRIWLSDRISDAWNSQSDTDGPVARAIALCTAELENPGEHRDGGYQGFVWVEALGPCLVAWKATANDDYRAAAHTYWLGLLNDHQTLGDELGPSYGDGLGIVAQDSGYSMRTHGVWAALGYDWLYDTLSAEERATAHERFAQWLDFHMLGDTYQRAQPGANYHAGHVLAVTLIAIAHADEMNALSPGSGTALYRYVTDEMWGAVMADGYGTRGTLRGGDWLEGWQYGALSVISYALAARALLEHGVEVPWLEAWSNDLFLRYVYGLTPADRMFVGGDTGADTPSLDPSELPLLAVIAGRTNEQLASSAWAELERLHLPVASDFRLFFWALAAAEHTPSEALDRATLPHGFLASGAGNFYGRTGFSATDSMFVSQCQGIVVDHQHQNAGNFVLTRGGDELVVDPGPYGSLSSLTGNAPTMREPQFPEEYQPSQGAWGERYDTAVPEAVRTGFAFTRATASNVLATRCDYTGQFRFRDQASQAIARATRDLVALPGAQGLSLVVLDRIDPGAGYQGDPMLLRFRVPAALTAQGDSASLEVGSSRLTVRKLWGDAQTSTRSAPGESCDGDRGKCEGARFPSWEWRVDVRGPSPLAIHVLDADASSAALSEASVTEQEGARIVSVLRANRRFHIASRRENPTIASYRVAREPSTHVVLDPPSGSRVQVLARLDGDACVITLQTANGDEGMASAPLVFAVSDECVVSEDPASLPPAHPPHDPDMPPTPPAEEDGKDGGPPGDPGASPDAMAGNGTSHARGGCQLARGSRGTAALLGLALWALIARRRRAELTRAPRP